MPVRKRKLAENTVGNQENPYDCRPPLHRLPINQGVYENDVVPIPRKVNRGYIPRPNGAVDETIFCRVEKGQTVLFYPPTKEFFCESLLSNGRRAFSPFIFPQLRGAKEQAKLIRRYRKWLQEYTPHSFAVWLFDKYVRSTPPRQPHLPTVPLEDAPADDAPVNAPVDDIDDAQPE